MMHVCRDCTTRSLGCHSICPDYLKFQQEWAKARKNKSNEKESFVLGHRPIKATSSILKTHKR